MTKSVKNILVTFIIGCLIFLLGEYLSGGFYYDSVSEALIDFTIYQLYAFVLGYSNMYFFDYMEHLQWK